MKKALSITFILGAITGSLLTVYLSDGGAQLASDESNAQMNSVDKGPRIETLNGEPLDIPGESTLTENKGPEQDAEESAYDPDEGTDAVPTQMEKFQRSIATETEVPSAIEELPTSVPEEAPPEILPESEVQEKEEDIK